MQETVDRVYSLNTEPATLFVNGIPMFDDEHVFNLDYSNISKVEIFNRKKFNLIDYSFYGILSIVTKDFIAGEKTEAENFSNFQNFAFYVRYFPNEHNHHNHDSLK